MPGGKEEEQELKNLFEKLMKEASGQHGVVDKHTVPPCTTKRRTTPNLKTKNN